MEKTFEEMTSKELLALMNDFDLSIEGKHESKYSKADMVEALNKYKYAMDNGIDPDAKEPEEEFDEELVASTKQKVATTKPSVVLKASKLSITERRKLQRADLFRKEPVIIHDTQTNQTGIPAMYVTWGNGLIGHQTDIVNLESDQPQYLRRGALQNLRAVMLHESKQDEAGGQIRTVSRPRFSIIPTEGLSEEELKVLAEQQRMRNAKY